MSDTIKVKELAAELGATVHEVAVQVTALCKAWGPHHVVVKAAFPNGACQLHAAAADQIRAVFAQTPAGAA